jgi:tetratricopeptide (TPR) repeat protein
MTRTLWQAFKAWDRPAQIGFALALVLMVPAAYAASTGSENIRTPALVGLLGLVIAAQAVFMWANRGMISPYTRAQRLFQASDFDGALAVLEELRANDQADVHALTLLGNTYRQVGDLAQSEAILYEAVNKSPDHYFPLYGFGRTLLVMGCYTEAAGMFERVLAGDALPLARYDLAEATYRDGSTDAAVAMLRESLELENAEPHRILMARCLLHRVGRGEPPTLVELREGLPYWTRSAALYQDTPYGQALAGDIAAMQGILEEN